jgi:putative glycosyltransferase (TIGR04372 family)
MAGPLFTRDHVATDLLYRDIGRIPERPFTILAHTLETTLGDLLSAVVFFATVKNQFEHARLHVCFRDVRPYSREILSLAPDIDRAEAIKGELPSWIRSLLGRDRFWRPLTVDARKGRKRQFYDFVINDWMADARNLHGLPGVVPLRIPRELKARLEHRLIERGLDQSKWFAVVHHRASSYRWRANIGGLRDSDPDAFAELTDFIIDDLGGQVVRLGHPEMGPLPERPGLVDLAPLENSFMLQACAVSRARFMVAGPSGAAALGCGFQIPVGIVDATDAQGGWGDMERVILTHEVHTPDGRRLRNRALLEAGLLSRAPLGRLLRANEGYVVRKCTGAELAKVAAHLHAGSDGVSAWRAPQIAASRVAPNALTWPPQTVEHLPFLDL